MTIKIYGDINNYYKNRTDNFDEIIEYLHIKGNEVHIIIDCDNVDLFDKILDNVNNHIIYSLCYHEFKSKYNINNVKFINDIHEIIFEQKLITVTLFQESLFEDKLLNNENLYINNVDNCTKIIDQYNIYKNMLENYDSKYYCILYPKIYVNIDNLLKTLNNYNHNEMLYIGGHALYANILDKSYNYYDENSLYILSKSALSKIIEICDQNQYLLNTYNSITITISMLISNIAIDNDITMITNNNIYSCNNYGRVNDDAVICNSGCSNRISMKDIVACGNMTNISINEMFLFEESIKPENKILDNPVPNYTIVTMLYHLPKYGDKLNKSIDYYLDKGRFTLSLPLNLVIYCDEEQVSTIMNIRRDNGFENLTTICPLDLNNFELFELKDKIKENRTNKPYYNDTNRNTPTYAALVACKFNILQHAIDNNYFNTEYFAWMDYGLSYVTGEMSHQLIRNLQLYREKVSFCYMEYTPENIMLNNDEYYKFGRCGTAAGFFTGKKDLLYLVCSEGAKKFRETVIQGYGHAEEQIVPLIYLEHNDWFEFFHGYYYQLFSNYDMIRYNSEITMKKLIPLLQYEGKYELCASACEKILYSFDNLNINIKIESLPLLLDSYFISLFYLGEYEKCWNVLNKHIEYSKITNYVNHFNVCADNIVTNSMYLINDWENLSNKKKICIYNDKNLSLDILYKNYYEEDSMVFVYSNINEYQLSSLICNRLIIIPRNKEINMKYDEIIHTNNRMKLEDFTWIKEDILTNDKFLELSEKLNNIIYFKTNYLNNNCQPINWRDEIHDPINKLENINIGISGHSDHNFTDEYVDSIKSINKWYAVNNMTTKDNVSTIPLGLTNDCDDSNYHRIFGNIESMIDILQNSNDTKDNLLYMNFSINTNPDRVLIYNLFDNENWVLKGSNNPTFEGRLEYLKEINNSKFILCPEGNGIDTHRLWEALYMRSIPIVKYRPMFEDFTHLPILFINNWSDINSEFLEYMYNEISNKEYDFSCLKMSYWVNKLTL